MTSLVENTNPVVTVEIDNVLCTLYHDEQSGYTSFGLHVDQGGHTIAGSAIIVDAARKVFGDSISPCAISLHDQTKIVKAPTPVKIEYPPCLKRLWDNEYTDVGQRSCHTLGWVPMTLEFEYIGLKYNVNKMKEHPGKPLCADIFVRNARMTMPPRVRFAGSESHDPINWEWTEEELFNNIPSYKHLLEEKARFSGKKWYRA